MPQNRDILWKALIESIFDDLLRFLYPNIDQEVNLMQPVVYIDKELAAIVPGSEEEMTTRVVDKLVKVQLRDKKFALIHVEIQGRTEEKKRHLFGSRMFCYFNLIFAKFACPIAAIVIFTGNDGHLFPDGFSYSLMNTRVRYLYRTVNIKDYSEEELAASSNPFAWVLLIAKLALLRGKDREKRWLEGKLFVLQKLYGTGQLEDRKLQAVLVFMERYLPLEDAEIRRQFSKHVDQLTNKKNTMDMIELDRQLTREESEKAARESVVRELLIHSRFSDKRIAAITKISSRKVAKMRKQIRSKKPA